MSASDLRTAVALPAVLMHGSHSLMSSDADMNYKTGKLLSIEQTPVKPPQCCFCSVKGIV